MYRYLLFDLDGTLTDPKIGITKCVQYALSKFGIKEPDLNKLTPFIGPPLLDSFHEFYCFDEEKGIQAIAYYRERFQSVGLFENEVYPGIPQLLARLKGGGRRLAVASSKPTVYVHRILGHFQLESYFDVVVGSELNGTRSRKEEVVEEALKQLFEKQAAGESVSDDRRRAQTAMIGDRKFDVEGARAFHIASIGVTYGYALPGELERAGADKIAGSVEELGAIICGTEDK